MELVAPQRDNWRNGALATGACLLSLVLSVSLRASIGNLGILLALMITAAVVSWYAGRWAGLMITGFGLSAMAFFFMAPNYSFHISDPREIALLYSFGTGGVILSLLCGAAWQLRAEAISWRLAEGEMVQLRSRNSWLALQAKQEGAALATSDRLLRQLAHSARMALESHDLKSHDRGEDLMELVGYIEQERDEPRPSAVDCNSLCFTSRSTLPAVWADENEIRGFFGILTSRAERGGWPNSLEVSASQLPEWWLFVAVFREAAGPLTPIEFSLCERIVMRQGGRCWANATQHGDWELRFLLPRVEAMSAVSRAS